jgi:PKD repeat protein
MKLARYTLVPLYLLLLIVGTLASTGCGGGASSAAAAAPQTPPAPTASLTANPTTVQEGQSVTLTWQTTNATTVTISGIAGNLPANGSQQVTPQSATTYTLTASGAGGIATATAPVDVTPPPPPTATLTANPTTVQAGVSTTLTWQTTNATAVIISGIGNVATSGSEQVTPASTTTYTLTATGTGGTATAAAQVTVTPPPPISAAFFGMTIGDTAPYPPTTVPLGAIGHPSLLAWDTIEGKGRGEYDFSFYDTFVNWATTNGVPFMMTFAWTPNWASVNCPADAICTVAPDDMTDWQNFVQAVVNHYNGSAEPTIKYYELWNEANSTTFWTGTDQQLAQMAQIAYPIIHQGSPNSLLLAPSVTGPLTSATEWMESYLQTAFPPGGPAYQYADGASFHGYLGLTGETPFPFPEESDADGYTNIVMRATTFRTIFDQNGLANKPMFDSEGSWGENNITGVNEQAEWLARWYLLQAGTGVVDSAYWFCWGFSNPGFPDDQQWGFISEDDQETPTAAGIAYGQVYNWLVGAVISTCTDSGNVWTCPLTRPGGYQGLAIWYYSASEVGTESYTPAAQFIQYRDLAGNITSVTGPITIGPAPVILETGTP